LGEERAWVKESERNREGMRQRKRREREREGDRKRVMRKRHEERVG